MTTTSHGPAPYLPLLSAAVPEGWTVSEGTVFTSSSGTEVRVRLQGAITGESSEDLAGRHLSAAADTADNLAEHLGDSAGFANLGGSTRWFSFDGPDGRLDGRITAACVGPVAVTAAASWPPGHSDAQDVDSIINAIDLRGSAEIRESSDRRWSEEELAVIAMLATGGPFPTVDADRLTAMPSPESDAVIAAVIRSLKARSLVELSDGTVNPIGAAADLCSPALSPSLVATVEVAGGGHHELVWFGVDDQRLCRIRVEPGGLRGIRRSDAESLMPSLLEFAGSSADRPGSGALAQSDALPESDAPELNRLSLPEILDPASSSMLVQIQTSWTQDEIQHGGVIAFVTHDGHSRLALEDPPPAVDPSEIDLTEDPRSGPPDASERSWTLGEAGIETIAGSLRSILPEWLLRAT